MTFQGDPDNAENFDPGKRFRWVQANEAAAILLGNCVTQVTQSLPLQAAKELGIGASTLEIYAALDADAREVADFYYGARGELKADMLKKIRLAWMATAEPSWPATSEGSSCNRGSTSPGTARTASPLRGDLQALVTPLNSQKQPHRFAVTRAAWVEVRSTGK